ncbi:MAG: hypothetical protein EU548_10020 [Promethearchaeota archaeon]|nr:MAG: hypothetical protein EU548_10020 [Candidatus Lokiarchaeota archaeon]
MSSQLDSGWYILRNLKLLKQLIKENSYESKDLPIFLHAIEELANSSEDIKDELFSINNLNVQINIIGVIKGWIKIIKHKMKTGKGAISNPDVILEMNDEVGHGMFIKILDTQNAYRNGDLKIKGDLKEAMRFRSLFEIISEELYFKVE